MMKKNIMMLLLLIAIIPKVYAYSYTVPTVNTSDPGTPYYDPNYDPYEPKRVGFAQDTEYKYFCNYKYYTYTNRTVAIDIYDETGTKLNPNRLIPDSLIFKAGTAIKLDINEETTAHWDIPESSIKVERQTYRCYKYSATKSCVNGWLCNTTIDYSSKQVYSNSSTSGCASTTNCTYWYRYHWADGKTYTDWYNCTHYESELITEPEPTSAHLNDCKNKAKSDVQTIINRNRATSSSYEVEYYDGNRINGGVVITEDGKNAADNNCNSITVNTLRSPGSGIKQCTFSYNLGKTCMNLITADVRYIKNGSSETCNTSAGEIEITNNTSAIKTNYFIPLDTKNADAFKLLLNTHQSQEPLNKNQCSYVKNNYEDWQNLIVDMDDNRIPESDFYIVGAGREKYKYSRDNCLLKTSIVFPTEQKFYGQTQHYDSLKGYGMYFRQINVDNPFPNGLSDNSYWKTLYIDKKVNGQSLSTSFDNPMYVANLTNANIDIVRSFNENNTYTKWTSDFGKNNGMNTDGSSNFIRTNGGIFTTRANSDTYCRLGYGPDWGGCR